MALDVPYPFRAPEEFWDEFEAGRSDEQALVAYRKNGEDLIAVVGKNGRGHLIWVLRGTDVEAAVGIVRDMLHGRTPKAPCYYSEDPTYLPYTGDSRVNCELFGCSLRYLDTIEPDHQHVIPQGAVTI